MPLPLVWNVKPQLALNLVLFGLLLLLFVALDYCVCAFFDVNVSGVVILSFGVWLTLLLSASQPRRQGPLVSSLASRKVTQL